jgi:hypothetical protein
VVAEAAPGVAVALGAEAAPGVAVASEAEVALGAEAVVPLGNALPDQEQ